MKACKHCGSQFAPQRPLQAVCSPICATRLVKAAKKEQAERDKARKEKIKTIHQLIREAQVVFNAWVRARDAKQPCISCGAPAPVDVKFQGGRDAGHYRSTGAASHLRFHPDNCHAQCVKCNQWKAGNVVDYRIRLIERIGLKRVEALETDNQVRKWNAEDLRYIKVLYREARKVLEAQHGV